MRLKVAPSLSVLGESIGIVFRKSGGSTVEDESPLRDVRMGRH
jgi:hypothetical protein